MKNEKMIVAAKCLLVFNLIFGLIFYAANKANPQLDAPLFFFGAVGVVAVMGFLLYCYFAIGSGFNQWMLNHGATDAQWLWFKSDPKGLDGLRKKPVDS